jgi:hypothetical protein
MCEVVNMNAARYDVYIGRPSKWGNPFSHQEDTLAEFRVKTRKEAVAKYEKYLLENKELMESLHELKGKVLGCYCKPLRCHGDVLKKYVDKLEKGIELTLF